MHILSKLVDIESNVVGAKVILDNKSMRIKDTIDTVISDVVI